MATTASTSYEATPSTFASTSASAPTTPPNGASSASRSPLANMTGNSSGLSLPDSPTSILAGTKSGRGGSKSVPPTPTPYEAPPIPKSWRESLSAWLKTSDSAAPELYLYNDTGYFKGAVLGNARNTDLATAFGEVRKSTRGSSSGEHDAGTMSNGQHASSASDAQAHLRAALSGHHRQNGAAIDHNELGRATVGTELAPNGKVGSIRKIDIGSTAPTGFTSWFSSYVPRLINMLEIGTPRSEAEIRADDKEEKVVLLHGYGAGTAFFFQNIKGLTSHPGSRLYALDWLGMGRSSRVPFHITSKQAKATETRVEAAETFFVQALEDWRRAMGVRKMTLIGHSLGGYLSVAYALKYPDNVSRLVLVSPAGIPENPEAAEQQNNSSTPPSAGRRSSQLSERELEQAAQKIAAEVQQPQEETAPQTAAQAQRDARQMARAASSKSIKKRSAPSSAETTDNEAEPKDNVPRPPRISKRRRDLVTFLWERNLSPFAILRGSLLFGPMMAGSYTSRRFGNLPDAELRALHAYCYAVFTERGSSEYCLGHLLAPFGYARMPLVHRVTALPTSLPVTFVYGARGIDWMSIDGGEEAVRRLRAAGNKGAHCFSVPNAGHHVYLDNPKAFDTLLSKVLAGEADSQ